MAKVYVLQDTGKHNYEKAERYGQMVFCSGSRDINSAFGLASTPSNIEVVSGILQALSAFNVEDKLVLSGNPVLIAVAVHFLMSRNGLINVLKWDGFAQGYHELLISENMIEALLNYKY